MILTIRQCVRPLRGGVLSLLPGPAPDYLRAKQAQSSHHDYVPQIIRPKLDKDSGGDNMLSILQNSSLLKWILLPKSAIKIFVILNKFANELLLLNMSLDV